MATTQRAPEQAPDLTLITVMHRAMRHDAARLAATVAGLEASGPGHGGEGGTARARALRRWYGRFHQALVEHHTIEDELFFPALAERVPTFADHLRRLDDDHHRLDELLTAVGADLDRLAEGAGSPATHRAVVAATAELSDLLHHHLGFEDADVLPLFLRHFTAAEYRDLDDRALKLADRSQLPFAVPWALAAADAAEQQRLFDQAGLPFKVLWYATRGRYARLARRAFGTAGAGRIREVA
jgi:hypothetical protein